MVKAGDRFVENFEISPELHAGFIALFGDRHRLHTDPDYARSLGFESVVVHGNILCGFLSYFVGECFPEPDVMILSQNVKFSQAVYLNDRLRLDVEVLDVHDSVNVVEIECRFRNAAGKSVASAKMNIGTIGDRRNPATPTS
jgi:3-hydroxybutyryl-CoA dehydratase